MTNLWEIAVLILSITVMVVNLWNIYLNTKLLQKFAPFLDKCMDVSDKFMDLALDQFKEDKEDNDK